MQMVGEPHLKKQHKMMYKGYSKGICPGCSGMEGGADSLS